MLDLIIRKTLRSASNVHETRIETINDVFLASAWADRNAELVMSIPVERLRGFGATLFTKGDHHLMRALKDGPESLVRHYNSAPTDIFTAHQLNVMAGGRRPFDTLPWLDAVTKDWVSSRQINGYLLRRNAAVEYRKMTKVAASISRHGYRPDLFGFPTGYFLADGRDWRFFVQGGNHRVCVIADGGQRNVGFFFRKGWPRIVHAEFAPFWPQVVRGKITLPDAQHIFGLYFSRHA